MTPAGRRGPAGRDTAASEALYGRRIDAGRR